MSPYTRPPCLCAIHLSKDEAAPMVAAAIKQLRRTMIDSRFLHKLEGRDPYLDQRGGEWMDPGLRRGDGRGARQLRVSEAGGIVPYHAAEGVARALKSSR